MKIKYDNDYDDGLGGCLTIIIILIINAILGAWAVAEILSWFGKDIPLIGDILLGMVAGEIAFPIAIVGWLLRIFGVF